MSGENLATELEWRGAIYDATPDALGVLAKEKIVAYNGFDPSAASFHVGNLVPIMGLVRLQRHGHQRGQVAAINHQNASARHTALRIDRS